MRILRLTAVLLVVLASVAEGQGATYQPPSLLHWCVVPDVLPDGTRVYTPRRIDTSQLPAGPDDHGWAARRYGPDSSVGTLGLHSPDYESALVDLGYQVTPWAVRDAYCTRDAELLARGQAVRIAGDLSTPFSPGFWAWGRRAWNVPAWRAFCEYNTRALEINMGAAAAAEYCQVIELQLQLAEQACRGEGGPAASPSAGAWRPNGYGVCYPSAWTRPGRLEPDWARPVRIELADPELGPGEPGPRQDVTNDAHAIIETRR